MPKRERVPLTTAQNYEVNNFKFKELYFTTISPIFPNSAYLEWHNDNQDYVEDVFPIFSYDVYRSQSPHGPFVKLNSVPVTDEFYIDHTIQQFSFERPYYFKITGTTTNLSSSFTVESNVDSLLADFRGLKRQRYLEHQKIKRDRRIQLSMVNAELYYLKKRRAGERCPDCYYEATRDKIVDKCETCYGATFLDPYFNPIRILVEYSQEQRNKNVTDKGYSEVTSFTVIMQDVPRVSRDDFLFDPNNDRIYKIIGYQQTLLNKSPLTQILTITELARDSIEYKIPIKDMPLTDLYPIVEELKYVC